MPGRLAHHRVPGPHGRGARHVHRPAARADRRVDDLARHPGRAADLLLRGEPRRPRAGGHHRAAHGRPQLRPRRRPQRRPQPQAVLRHDASSSRSTSRSRSRRATASRSPCRRGRRRWRSGSARTASWRAVRPSNDCTDTEGQAAQRRDRAARPLPVRVPHGAADLQRHARHPADQAAAGAHADPDSYADTHAHADARGADAAQATPRTSSSASTTSGSNCVPAPARSSATASSCERAGRYGRGVIIAAYASQARMMREPSGMWEPARPSG